MRDAGLRQPAPRGWRACYLAMIPNCSAKGQERRTSIASRRDISHPFRSSQKRRQSVQMQNSTPSPLCALVTWLVTTSRPPRWLHGVLSLSTGPPIGPLVLCTRDIGHAERFLEARGGHRRAICSIWSVAPRLGFRYAGMVSCCSQSTRASTARGSRRSWWPAFGIRMSSLGSPAAAKSRSAWM